MIRLVELNLSIKKRDKRRRRKKRILRDSNTKQYNCTKDSLKAQKQAGKYVREDYLPYNISNRRYVREEWEKWLKEELKY